MEGPRGNAGSVTPSQRRSRSRSRHRRPSSSSLRRPSLKRSSSSSNSLKLIDFTRTDSMSSEIGSMGVGSAGTSVKEPTLNDEIPWLNATLDNSLPLDYFKQDMISILQAMSIPRWCKLNGNDPKCLKEISVERISGALTNSIYKISYKKLYPLLLRLYGSSSDSIIDRDTELETLAKLSRKNIGPKLLGFFTNGRFEQFLNNSITLTAKQIKEPKVSRIIARRMKELHMGVNVELKDKIEGPICFNTIDKWIKHIENIIANGSSAHGEMSRDKQIEMFSLPFDTFSLLVQKYKKALYLRYNKGMNFFNEVVFCHNDTQYGNLMFYNPEEDDLLQEIISEADQLSLGDQKGAAEAQKSAPLKADLHEITNDLEMMNKTDSMKFDKKLVVIDFEYSGANVPLYDITNHFCEWMYDYNDPQTSYMAHTQDYPSREERLNFIKSYYKYNNRDFQSNGKEKETFDPDRAKKHLKKLYNDCLYWRAANCIFWALWAIMKVIDLDQGAQQQEIAEFGPNGEKYLIKEQPHAGAGGEEEGEDLVVVEESNFSTENSDDEFDYKKYALDKIGISISDFKKLGLLDDSVDLSGVVVKELDFDLFES